MHLKPTKTTESIAEHQLVDPSIFTLASDSGCFLVLSSCVICVAVYDKHNTKAHKAMETHKHYRPTNKISACAYESNATLYPLSACFTKSTNRNCAISSVGGRTTETQSRKTASQNKCQRSSLSCWCLHSLQYQVIEPLKSTLFVSVVPVPPKLLKLNHTSLQLRAAQKQFKNKVENTSTSRISRVFPNFGRTCRD